MVGIILTVLSIPALKAALLVKHLIKMVLNTTKCSKPVNHKCFVSTLWSQYFLNEFDIASAGQLDTCYFGYNFCKVLFVLNF